MIMELEDLKTTWQSVKPHINSQIIEDVANGVLSKRSDIKSRLLKRAIWEGIITMICLILMALSPFWSPMKFPYWWLAVFCSTIIVTNLYGIRIYRSIRAINLWEDSNNEILKVILSVKRLYRNVELVTAIVLIPLLIWLSLTPMFIHSWRMFFTWGITVLAFSLEYLWYRNNIKQLNNLVNWEKE